MKKRLFCCLFALALLLTGTALADTEALPDYQALYAEECLAMGMDGPCELLDPAETGLDPEYAKFSYSVITPDSIDTPDEDCFVIVLMGDGFTETELDLWRYKAQHFANVVVHYSPINEYSKYFKIYRVDAISNESGVSADDSADGRYTAKDTYFGGYLWSSGMARLGGGNNDLRIATGNAYCPNNTDCTKTVIYNTEVYGGSGGGYASLSWAYIDVAFHEITHNITGLPDEYLYSGTGQLNDAKASYRYNWDVVYRDWLFNEEWQDWNPWYRLIGKNGTHFDAWTEGEVTTPEYLNVYRPKDDCKMRYVGANVIIEETGEEEFSFCEICKECWRETLCLISHQLSFSFQPYNDQFYDNSPVFLNNRHFILRIPTDPNGEDRVKETTKAYAETLTAAEADNHGVAGEVRFSVSDASGAVLYADVTADTPLELPAGEYSVTAVFTGTFNGEAVTLTLPAYADNTFTVRRYSPVYSIGSYEDIEVNPSGDGETYEIHNMAEIWQDKYNADVLNKDYDGTPVALPAVNLREDAPADSFEITYDWHVQNFDGSAGTQLGATAVLGVGEQAEGPSGVGSYVLQLHIRALEGAPAAYAGMELTEDYAFTISTPYHTANFYEVDGGTYSHELVANDFRGITITGEGFTEAEQDKFEAAAEAFIKAYLDAYPVCEMPERFCFFIENTMSASSGVTQEGGERKDTFYGLQINADGTIGTYRTDRSVDLILFQEAWRRDTNMKTWAQWGATVVLVNDEETAANYNYRHPECNRAVCVSTIADGTYSRLIESLVTQFAFVRSDRSTDLLDTVRWMEGEEQNMSPEEIRQRLIESCYSHEMYYHRSIDDNNMPRPVIVCTAAGTVYESAADWNVEECFAAYSYGHVLQTGVTETDTFLFNYYKDDNYTVGEALEGKPTEPGTYWVEAILPRGQKWFKNTETDRYGYTYEAGEPLPGVNGLRELKLNEKTGVEEWTNGCDENGVGCSTTVRGFARVTIAG